MKKQNLSRKEAQGVPMRKKTDTATGICPGSFCEEMTNPDFYPMDMETKIEKRRVLLHSCCGPCSTACIERLLPDYQITVFFYNPNITDADEYERRKAAQIQFLNAYNERIPEEDRVAFIEGEYLPEDYFNVCPASAMNRKAENAVQSALSSG